jgi:hypothetical protein
VIAVAASRKRMRLLGKHAWLSVLGGLVMTLAMSGAADAYWAATGTGSGSGPVETLAAPTSLSGTAGAGTVALSWSAVTPPGSGSVSVSYYVQRDGVVVGGCQALVGTTCTDSGLIKGTYSYTVTAVWQSWTSASSPADVTLASGPLASFTIPTPGPQIAGTQFSISITAKDAYDNTVTAYAGTQCLTFSGPANSPNGTAPIYPAQGTCPSSGQSAVTFAIGAASANVTLYNAAWTTITVTGSGKVGSTGAFTVNPLGASSLRLAAVTTTPTAGQADLLTITALDQYGNTATSYTGSQNLTFSGAGMAGTTHPTVTNSSGTATAFGTATAISFTNGVSTLGGVMTLYKAETANISATGGGYTTNTLWVTVSTGPLASFAIPTPAAQTAGTQFSISITAKDAYGNTATGYTDLQCLTFSGPGASPNGTAPSYPAQGSCASGLSAVTFTNGVAATVPLTLYNPSTSTILTATDALSGRNGSTGAFTVNAAAVASFTISTPATQTAGTPFSVSITAKDAYGNTATGYTGAKSVVFTGAANSPGGTAPSYPASVTFAAGVAATVPITLYNAASTMLTATEAGKSGASGPFTVNPAGINSFTFPTPATQTAGTAFNVSLTAKDAYGNTATDYSGAKSVVFTGAANSPGGTAPSYPSSVTFTNGIAATVPITLYNAASTTLTATEASKSGSTGAFTVNPLAISSLRLTAATTTPTAGQTDALTITALDQYGNTATAYNASPNLTFTGATAIGTFIPTVTNAGDTATNFGTATAITFTGGVATVSSSANGVMRLYRAQSVSIVVSDGPHTNGTGLPVTVSSGPPNSFTVSNPGTRTAGIAFNVTLTATADAYGNAGANYTGTHCITFSGPTASPNGTAPLYPAKGSCGAGQSAVTFASGVGTATITLYDATTSTTLTATDVVGGTTGTSGAFAVNGLQTMSTFVLTANPTNPTAGQAVNVTITAGDTWGNALPNRTYSGSHTLTFSGASVIGTINPTVNAVNFGTGTALAFSNAGVATAVMRLYKVETANIVVSEGTHNNGGGLQVTVAPAAMNNIALSAEKVVVRPGAADQLTIRAIDQYGNPAPGYADGPHDVTFSGGTGTRTVTNSGGGTVNFGTSTSITFTNGISTAGGVLQINTAQTASITVSDGTHTSAALRIVVSSVSASMVSAGGFHTCALVAGTVECWGDNESGELGNNTTTNSSSPVMVKGVGGTGTLSGVTQISAGKYHTCALVSGSVYCWGENDYGELGNNSTTDSWTPVQVRLSATTYLTGVTQVSASGKFTCALLSAGTVRCWGHNQYGQLGNGNTNDSSIAVQVSGITNAIQVTNGANQACALLSDNTVKCWGYNNDGQLGDGSITNRSTPVQVVGASGSGSLTGVSIVSGGRLHTCALLSGGTVYCWGDNGNGELGDGTTTNRSLPVRAGSITNASTISAGEYHSCAVLSDGTAQCWGASAYGQVGDGTTADTSTPVTVIGPGGWGSLTGIAAISAGGADINETSDYEHTCALTTDGTVVCWGQNNYGQLGNGTTTMSVSPAGVALQ